VNPTLNVNAEDGTFKAYIARPAIVPAPAIVVVYLRRQCGLKSHLR
jgi:hypothetical protein